MPEVIQETNNPVDLLWNDCNDVTGLIYGTIPYAVLQAGLYFLAVCSAYGIALKCATPAGRQAGKGRCHWCLCRDNKIDHYL